MGIPKKVVDKRSATRISIVSLHFVCASTRDLYHKYYTLLWFQDVFRYFHLA
jgi:hypothetical protein